MRTQPSTDVNVLTPLCGKYSNQPRSVRFTAAIRFGMYTRRSACASYEPSRNAADRFATFASRSFSKLSTVT